MSYITEALDLKPSEITSLTIKADTPTPESSVKPLSFQELISRNPTTQNIPDTWSQAMLPPGMPVAPIMSDQQRLTYEKEPRSFQYIPAFNTNLTPRISIGLMPFSLLKWYNETISEAALMRRLRIAALTDFVPQIVDKGGEVIQKAEVKIALDSHGKPQRDEWGRVRKLFTGRNAIEKYPELGWLTKQPYPDERKPCGIVDRWFWTEPDGTSDMTRWLTKSDTTPPPDRYGLDSERVSDLRWQVARPDRFNAFPEWLSRFMVNYIMYNAPAVYKIRGEDNQIVGLRVIDGSTIFAMIDVRGETPAPPAPAFSQIIWGTPKQWFNTYQIWYHPYPRRIDSPYGYTSAEDGLQYLQFIYQWWQWSMGKYNAQAIPTTLLKTPPGTQPEPIFEFLRVMQAQIKGNPQELFSLYPLPPGTEPADVKRPESDIEEYLNAVKGLALEYNVHPSELGMVTGGTGLSGSKSIGEKGEEQHARIGVIPDHIFVEMLFNDILLEMAELDDRFAGLTWQLAAPDAVINPQVEDAKWDQVWQFDGMTWNEYRDRKGLENVDGEEGDFRYSQLKALAEAQAKIAAAPAVAPDANGGPQEPEVEPEPGAGEGGEEVDNFAQVLKFEDVVHDGDGAMIAVFIPIETATKLRAIIESIDLPEAARLEKPENMHVTLTYFPSASGIDRDTVVRCMKMAALYHGQDTLEGNVGGYGVFLNEEENVVYASLDAPSLPEIRQVLCDALAGAEIEYAKDHGFTPHITLAYLPKDYEFEGMTLPNIKVSIDGLTFSVNDLERTTVSFKDGEARMGKLSNAYVGNITKFERFWHVEDLRKHCGVCPEDDDYFGAPLSRAETVLFPHQGANETEIVAMTPAGLEARPALWKPEGGEDEMLVEALGGPQYVREEAAYLLDRILNIRAVPLAYVSEIDGEHGAAIMYVRGNEPRQESYDAAWVEKAAVLDYIMGQCDRRTHNVLTHPDDETRPILIDNGLTFPTAEKIIGSMFVDAFRGQPLSEDSIARIRKCLGNLEWHDIAALVGRPAVELAKQRAQTLIDKGQIPA